MLFAVIVLDRRRREVAGVVAGVDDLRFCLGVLISSAREVPASIATELLFCSLEFVLMQYSMVP